MTTTILLSESTKAPIKVGSKWRVTVAVPGKGSSGMYSAEVLENDGPTAIPPGTKAWFTHTKRDDPRDQVGVYETGAFWNEEEQELQADLTVFPHWRDVVDAIGPGAETSIRVQGEKDSSGNVVRLNPHRTNSVDLVGYGGLEGSGLKFQIEQLLEAARNASIDTDSQANNEAEVTGRKNDMDPKEIVEAVTKAFTDRFDAFVAESRVELQGKADEDAVQAAAQKLASEFTEKFLAVKDEIAEAGLTPSQVKVLEAKALRGEDITEDLKEAKELVAEISETLSESLDSNLVLGEGKKNVSFNVAGWSK